MEAIYYTQGGFKLNSIYSGGVSPIVARSSTGMAFAGSDVQLQVGGGRLNSIIPHVTVIALSGVVLTLYDAALPVSGGPVAASGHIQLGGLAGPSGVSGLIYAANEPIHFNVPFYSGLCLNSRSGQPGVTIVWTPEDFSRSV